MAHFPTYRPSRDGPITTPTGSNPRSCGRTAQINPAEVRRRTLQEQTDLPRTSHGVKWKFSWVKFRLNHLNTWIEHTACIQLTRRQVQRVQYFINICITDSRKELILQTVWNFRIAFQSLTAAENKIKHDKLKSIWMPRWSTYVTILP